MQSLMSQDYQQAINTAMQDKQLQNAALSIASDIYGKQAGNTLAANQAVLGHVQQAGQQYLQQTQLQLQQQQVIASPCCGNDTGNGVGNSSGGAPSSDAGQGQAAGSSGTAGAAGTAGPSRDDNFLSGLRALLARLRGVVHAQLEQDLAA